jgi:PAS domain S-box-containing protein
VLLSSAITGSVVVAMIILLLILFLKRVVKPLRAITRTAISIANGNLDAVVPVTSNDEIGRLCESFNTMSEDIKTRTRSLLQSNKRLEEAQKTACLGNWERDIVKNELCWSDEIYRIFGLSPQGCSITYNEFLQYVHPDDREYVKKSVNNAISGMEPYEIDYRILPKNGAVRIIHEKALVVRDSAGKAIHIVGTIQDITERRQREEEVHLLQALILAVGSAKDMHDALAVTLEKVCSVTGWVYGETWVPCKDGRYLVRDYTFYNKIERLKKFSDLSAEYRFSPGVGLPGMVWLTKQPVWIEDVTVHSNFPRALIAKEVGLRAGASFPVLINGEVVAVIAFFMFEPCEKDERFVSLVSSAASQLGQVINRKHAEESLIKSEHLLQSILDNTTSVVYVKDIQGRYIFVNKQFEKLFHTTKDEIKGETDYDIWPAKIADAFRLNDRRVIESRTPIEFDEAVPHDDGQHSYISVKFPLFSVAGDVYAVCGISTDITERKSMEEEKNALREQLYHVQKLESVGKLAGGIAHDFNNILMAISGYCSLLEMEMKEDSPSGKCVQQILASAERGENLIRSLLIFSRKGEGTPKPEDLNKIVYNVADLLLKLIGENVKLDISPADKECIVMVDKGQIEQVLMNLATNARDAMPKGGALKISIETSVVDDTFIELHHYGKIGVYGVLSVSDTGTGMDEETKKKAFEPFFTTKGVGKGTGLGLSIVYGIIKHHEGYINIYSEPGKGTTFNIYLPAAKSKGEEEMSESLQTVKGGTETILLADDDANVRDVTALVLKKNGYKVIEAVNGEDALRKFAEYADKIQLLVLDIMMPGKNGKEVYDEIRKTGANVNALFMSGYAEDIISGTVIREEGLHFIAKPISPAKFLKKIRDVLDT